MFEQVFKNLNDKKFKPSVKSADILEYKSGEIVGEIKNKFQIGYTGELTNLIRKEVAA